MEIALLFETSSESDSGESLPQSNLGCSVPELSSTSTNSTSDSESYRPKRKLHRIENFVEDTIKKYDDREFKEHFRLSRSTCNFVIEKVKNAGIIPKHKFGRKKISVSTAVYLTVWYLSNTETFRQIADRFNITLSSAHRILRKVVTYLVSISDEFIKWPHGNERVQTSQDFYQVKHIKHIIGAIDGSHISIKRPKKDAYVYCNRKGGHSILLQAVCDSKKKIMDVFCGEAGSIHDSRLLKRSSLYEKGLNGFFGNYVLLGDSAYPCLSWLIPPYKDNGNLSNIEKKFNYCHSATRIVIENCFGLLKGRFRRLTFFYNEDISFIVECVVAACVLHNICLDCKDDIDHKFVNSNNNQEDISHLSSTPYGIIRREEMVRQMFGSNETCM